jgi:hypothetical protein
MAHLEAGCQLKGLKCDVRNAKQSIVERHFLSNIKVFVKWQRMITEISKSAIL